VRIDQEMLLGTWYTIGGVSKVRFCKDGLAHWRQCPFGLRSRRMEGYGHDQYTLNGRLLTMSTFKVRHLNREGGWIDQTSDGSSYSRSSIVILTKDHLLCEETIFFGKDRESLAQKLFELVRKRPEPHQ
jgi:hypothetical protein